MVDRKRTFIADELWLFIAIVTLPVAGTASVLGLPGVAEVSAIIGWFLLTPIFLFWGEYVATLCYGEAASTSENHADPIETLKDQYANDEIDDQEFERRLDRLLDAEERTREPVRDT